MVWWLIIAVATITIIASALTNPDYGVPGLIFGALMIAMFAGRFSRNRD